MRKQYRHHKYLDSSYTFINRNRWKEKYLIVLSGYKEYLYDIVFGRLKAFLPEDIDVCLITSGKYDRKISQIAENNRWSYLYTKKNKIAIAQNLAIKINPCAKYIYKMDEDIFLTSRSFENLQNTFEYVKTYGESDIGFVAPLIPLNGYGYMKILEEYNLKDLYSEKFEKPLYSSYPTKKIISDPEVAQFFWGKGGYIDNIDELNKHFQDKKPIYYYCPIRFSIGFIYFTRDIWEGMGMFRTVMGSGLGVDEEQICSYCVVKSLPMIISGNSVVGHFSFGPQTPKMIEYLSSAMEYYRV